MDRDTLKPFFEPFHLDLIDDGQGQYLVRVTKDEYAAALASYQKPQSSVPE